MNVLAFARRAGGAVCAYIALSSLCASAEPAASASPTPSPAPSGLSQIGRVSTSDRRDEPLGLTSKPTFVVDRAQIDAFGARSVADALQGVPGMDLFSYGAFGAQVDYGIRGALSTQTLVLVDGSPVTDPTTGSVNLAGFSTVGVERIEVVESGSSTLYGTSAAGGVINIITHVPRGVYLEGSYGSFADRDVRLSAGEGGLGIAFERHVADNDYPYPTFAYGPGACEFGAVKPCAFAAGTRSNAYGDQSAADITLDRAIGDLLTVRGRVNLSSIDIGVPGQLGGLSPGASQADANAGGQVDVALHTGASTISLTASAAQQRQAYDDFAAGGEDDVYWGRSQISLKDAISGTHVDAVAGIDLSRESGAFAFASSPNYADPSATPIPAYGLGKAQAQSAAYAQIGGSPLRGVRLTAGLRGENDSPNGSVLAPSFGGIVREGNFSLAGNLGENFRVPTLQDLYYPGFSNPHLVPEKAATSDATLGFDAGAASFSAGWFSRNGSNFIVFDPVQNIPINESRASTEGIALTASTRTTAGLVATLGYTDLYRALNLITGARLPENPAGQLAVSLSHPFGATPYAFGIRWAVQGSTRSDAANVPPPLSATYDSYATLDGYVRYKLSPHAILSVRGFNLTNAAYAPIFGYPAPGRRYGVELSTR